MISFWNQREIYIGAPSEKLNAVIKMLTSNCIQYKCRFFNKNSAHLLNSKAIAIDLFGLSHDYPKIYYIYVHRKDYVKATELLVNGGLINLNS